MRTDFMTATSSPQLAKERISLLRLEAADVCMGLAAPGFWPIVFCLSLSLSQNITTLPFNSPNTVSFFTAGALSPAGAAAPLPATAWRRRRRHRRRPWHSPGGPPRRPNARSARCPPAASQVPRTGPRSAAAKQPARPDVPKPKGAPRGTVERKFTPCIELHSYFHLPNSTTKLFKQPQAL